MDYAAYQVGRYGSLPPSTKVLHAYTRDSIFGPLALV